MPQVDPKFTFYFGLWTNVLAFIAGVSVEHAPAIIAQYAPAVQWFLGNFVQVNGIILTALVGVSSTKPGPLVSVSPGAIKPIVILAIALVALLAVPGAQAQGLAPKARPAAAAPVDPLQQLMDQITAKKAEFVAGVVAAVQEADDDAASLSNPSDPTSFRDPVAHACYPAQIKFLQSLPQVQAIKSPAPYSMIVLFQRKRDLIAQIKAGLPGYLKVGCAALLQDEKTILLQTLGLIGVTVGAGALTGIFPAAAPIALPALTLPAL
ncbi:hypothetical protein ACRQ5Q_22205 [Bradyrhizobium sp. PMVTL-01]|uniref:hypothetical protein n=1 Tax=Bradyrhizobium sp. PMVTL-01 TaxID=3434999 RepID=UPI003F6E92B3